MSIRIQVSSTTVKALHNRLQQAYLKDDVRLVRSSPKCAVKSLSGYFRLCSTHFTVLLYHLLGMCRLPLVVLRHIEVTFARTPDLVLLC